MTCLRLLSGLLLLAACGSGGGSSADDTTGTPPATATDPGSSTAVTGGGTTEDATGAGPVTTSATGTTASTGPGETSTTPTTATTGEPSTGTPGTSTGGTTDPGTTGDATTGGPVGACAEVDGDYGPCDAILGVAFQGGSCRYVSGCNCEPDCALFFDDPVACATTCAAAGECEEAQIMGAGIAPDEVGPGSFCDEVDACVNLPELMQLFPELVCEGQGMPCGGQNCHLQFAGELTPEVWQKVCAASLLPGVDELYCVVFGP